MCKDCQELKARVEQLEVQLAGCMTAAAGWSRGATKAKRGDYGWSPAYQDTLKLRQKYERLVRTS